MLIPISFVYLLADRVISNFYFLYPQSVLGLGQKPALSLWPMYLIPNSVWVAPNDSEHKLSRDRVGCDLGPTCFIRRVFRHRLSSQRLQPT